MGKKQVLRGPHGSALRRARHSLKLCVYHIIACTHDRRSLFTDFGAARAVIRELQHSERLGRTITFAFVVMPDHLHWLMQLAGNASLSHVVQMTKSFSARHVNNVSSNCGRVWQRGFYDHGIRSDEDLATVARYIVANPLRAGLVKNIGDYPHWDAIWL